MRKDVQALFAQVADLDGEQRRRIYSEQGISPEVQQEVESLLRHDGQGESLLTGLVERSAAGFLEGDRGAVEGMACGAFRLIRIAGRGGMGAVYLAERSDGEVKQRAAIKFLRWDIGEGAQLDRFLRERQILADLEHPGIARLLDAGRTGLGQPYLAMEYVEGVPLDQYAATLDVRGKLALFLQVCDAVSYLHRNLVIHRDLKPSNILVDGEGRTKLLDFGIAKVLDATVEPGATREVLLTPEFASPEQLRGAAQTTATDVYSLGAVLYTLMTGRSPHAGVGEAGTSLEEAIADREPPPASSVNHAVPRDLDYVLAKTLRKQPEERYASAEALAEELRAILEHRPVKARQGDAFYRARRWMRRHWVPAAAGVVTVAALTAGMVAANRERKIAEQRFDQVRTLVRELFALDREVAGLAGSTQPRHKLVSTALRYLEGLSAGVAGDPELAYEVGAAYSQVAQIQGVPARNNLGQFAEAEQTLAKAEQFLEQAMAGLPREPRVLFEAAMVDQYRMILAESGKRRGEAIRYAERAAQRIDQLSVLGGLQPEQSRAAAAALGNIALAHLNMHLHEAAARHARQAVAFQQKFEPDQPPPPGAIGILASALRFLGDLDGALAAAREARGIAEAEMRPDDTRTQFNLASALWREAMVLGAHDGVSLGRSAEAAALLERELEILERLSRADLRESTSRARTATAVRELGPLLRERHPQRAVEVYQLGLKRLGELSGHRAGRSAEAELYAGLSYALRDVGRREEAAQRARQAVAMLKAAGGLKTGRVETGSEAERVLRAEADDLIARGEGWQAAEKYEELLRLVLASEPDPETALRDASGISRVLEGLARAQVLAGNAKRAEEIAARRLGLWRHWQAQLPGNVFVERQVQLSSPRR